MERVVSRERESGHSKEWLLLGIGAGFGVGYLIALMQHQAELTQVLQGISR